MNIERQKRYRAFLIVLVYLIIVMYGISSGIFLGGMLGDRGFFYSIVLAIVLTQICIIDSQIMGKPLSILNYWMVFTFYGIAVPICIIRARGLRGLGILAIHFVGLTLVYNIAWYVTSLILYGVYFS
jgi:hypothetical protein